MLQHFDLRYKNDMLSQMASKHFLTIGKNWADDSYNLKSQILILENGNP